MKKLLTALIGIVVAIGIFQNSDGVVKVAEEVTDVIPDELVVGDIISGDNPTTSTSSLLILDEAAQLQLHGPYPVITIADGDTITVDIQGTHERVRLLGIDAPETSSTDAVASECYAEDAKRALTSLLTTNQNVYLEYDASQGLRDKYDRLLAYVFIKSEAVVSVNNYLVQKGFVYEYTYNKPYKYQRQFQQSEVDAYELERGLWGVCTTPDNYQT